MAPGSSAVELQAAPPPAPSCPVTRLQHGIRKERGYTDGMIKYGFLTHIGEPHNLEEALGDDKWKSAMDDEYLALQRNNTWHLVPPQKGTNVIDCK